MTPVDAAIVRRKLGHIIASLELLGPIRGMALEEYRRRVWERKGVERILQEAIEAALDVNAHLTAELGQGSSVPPSCRPLAIADLVRCMHPHYMNFRLRNAVTS